MQRVTYYRIFIVIVVLILLVPLAQRHLDLFPRKRLINVSVDRRMPLFRWSDIKTGRFQKSFDRWYMQSSGTWGALVTTHNQISYQYFKQIASHYGNGNNFMVGKDFNLYQTSYLRDYNSQMSYNLKHFMKLIAKAKLLQDYLERQGKTLIILTSTNKLVLYPDIVVDQHKLPNPRKRLVEYFRKLALKHNLNWVDSTEVLKANKDFPEFRYFAKPAAHWNTIGSCLVSKALMEKAAERLKKPLHKIQCGPEYTMKPRPMGADHDLAEVINVWNPGLSFEPTPYIESKRNTVPNAFSPKFLYVGTSFLWSIFDRLEPIRAYNWRDFYYYGSTNHSSRIPEVGKADRKIQRLNYKTINWDEDVLGHDVFVFEVNEARLQQVGFAFLPNIIKELKARKIIKPENKKQRKLRKKARQAAKQNILQ